jgi:DNA-binding NtrC family response regulator
MSTPAKILFVDDDANFLAALQRTFRKQFNFEMATSGPEALEMLREKGPFAVIVADVGMPEMDGIELLAWVTKESPATVQVVLTGKTDFYTFAESVNRGNIFRYVAKSYDGERLRSVLIEALQEAKKTGAVDADSE